ncbi:RNA-directed DNA polymerase [Hymenobacter weizhouensis]|uniref:RNA-directed DNA polymerase n=1 Tax=Hymenobacter sp. YIM 151500-1 TaxID=2987689 RepID=UPI002225E9D7|nr:RNA-directed DNA polymerase [Hymenobacter sp. YIM 151500-1]UYZ62317.1 RNA-directed DNA polymerase [Hymenobacter sp. YIM 151500-1]
MLNLNLALAWKRLKEESQERGFIVLPYEYQLIENNLSDWLGSIDNRLNSKEYKPSYAEICDVPKGQYLIRPGAILTTEDLLVYYALAGSLFEYIYNQVEWAQYKIDCSNALNIQEGSWILDPYRGWDNFRTKSLSYIKTFPYVVVSDISCFFENIDHTTLLSNLKATQAPEEVIQLLGACLGTWSQVPARGLPQGCVPSDILAKLYLNSVDKFLYNQGYKHCRYVDDFRIFCTSLTQAKQAIVDLTKALRKKGLSLHSSKTKIYDAEQATYDFAYIPNIINNVNEQIKAKKKEEVVEPSAPGSDIEDPIDPKDAPIGIIKSTFNDFFVEGKYDFNKTLYRFLLRRLREEKDDYAADHCTYILSEHPEETHTVLKYFDSIEYPRALSIVSSFFCSEQTIYCYQNYQIIRWFNQKAFMPDNVLIDRIRKLAFNQAQPYYLRSTARNFISTYGDASDIEVLEDICKASHGLEQSELICFLKNLEKGRRNSFFSRIEHNAQHNKSAIRIVKSGALRAKRV